MQIARARKRVVLGACFMGFAALAAAAASSSSAAPRTPARATAVNWQMQTLNAPVTATGREYADWAKALQAQAGINLNIHYNIGLGYSLNNMVALTSNRSVDLGELLGGFTEGAWPGLSLPDVPGLIPPSVKVREAVEKALLPYYQKQAGQYNQVYLGYCQADPRTLISTKPIRTLADFKGLKIRTASAYEAQLTQELGATPVTNVPATEIYTALQTGVLDGAWAVSSYFESQKFYEVAKYVLNVAIGGASEHITVNKNDWNALTAAQQSAVKKTFNAFLPNCYEQVNHDYLLANSQLQGNGVTISNLSAADQKQLARLTVPFAGNWAATHGSDAPAMFHAVEAVLGTRNVSAVIAASRQVPRAKGTHGSGKLTGSLLPTALGANFTWRVSYRGTSGAVTAVRLGIADAGKSGRIAATLCSKRCHSGMTGTTALDKTTYQSLVKGTVYVELVTAKNPGGESRGQLTSQLQK